MRIALGILVFWAATPGVFAQELVADGLISKLDPAELPTEPLPPKMTAFYSQCMATGGTPGQHFYPKQRFYWGTRQLFQVYTPPLYPAGSMGLVVTHYQVDPESGNRYPVSLELEPGQAIAVVTDELYLGHGLQGRPPVIEYCVKITPIDR